MNQQKVCLECGEPIIGRIDKKFCSDYCRNAYNNRKNRDANNMIRRINLILKKNRRILNELNQGEKTKVRKQTLVEKGFNFEYFTSIYVAKNGNIYKYIYDEGYRDFEDGWVLLVKNLKK